MPDPLELPSYETMNQELAAGFAEGAQVIAQVRDRRTERLLSLARTKKQLGNDDEALNAYVESLFLLGPERAPEDAKVAVSREVDTDQLKDVLGAH